MNRTSQTSQTPTTPTEFADDALSHDLIGSGAWVLPLVIATFLVYREFKKSTERGQFALALLMVVGIVIILVPMFGSIVLVLAMLALIIFILERLH
jgi:4-hydroxybenzoate polyprenyltransferase